LAVFVGTPEIFDETPDVVPGISRLQLLQASNSPGYLACHTVQTCGCI
jgi:hypothetical protein